MIGLRGLCGLALLAVPLQWPAGAASLWGASISRSSDTEPVTDESEAHAIINAAYALAPYGPDGDRYLFELQQRLLHNCMDARGFDYVEYPFYPNPPIDENAPALVPPLPSEDDVRESGYHAWWPFPPWNIPELTAESGAAEAANADEASEHPGWNDALVSDDDLEPGCQDTTMQAIEERVPLEARRIYNSIADEMSDVLFTTPEQDSTLADAASEWSACMRDAGYDYQYPGEAKEAFRRDVAASPSVEEIRQALADRSCQLASHYRDVRLMVLADLVRA